MQRHLIILAGLALLCAGAAVAQQKKSGADPILVNKAIEKSWTTAAPEWQTRLDQDETQKACSQYRNSPPKDVAAAIVAREQAAIVYPADGKLIGDWQKGERAAQNGRGGQFNDPPGTASGGNCYACHQMAPKEISFGTLGPPLVGYGKLRDFTPEAVKATYEKIYDAQATFACSNMPRFGANKVLTPEQIKDLVALLMDKDSPVNK